MWMEEDWSTPVGNRRVVWGMYECRTAEERKRKGKRHCGSRGFADACACNLRARLG